MSENITTIKDPKIHFKPSENLVTFLKENLKDEIKDGVPENIRSIIKNKNNLLEKSDIEWLNDFLDQQRNTSDNGLLTGNKLNDEIDKVLQKKDSNFDYNGFVKEKNKNFLYLHELLKGCELILPKNEVIERNPVLAERIEKLKKEQEEREYRAMTQNVDMTKKFVADNSIGHQMNMLNRHLIAVFQFLLSVSAGFAFGFLGIELIVGELNFGVRILLGISCALVIAIAEFYFLAKYLNEEDKEELKSKPTTSKIVRAKLHKE